MNFKTISVSFSPMSEPNVKLLKALNEGLFKPGAPNIGNNKIELIPNSTGARNVLHDAVPVEIN